jgi:hypothetical protein
MKYALNDSLHPEVTLQVPHVCFLPSTADAASIVHIRRLYSFTPTLTSCLWLV